MITVDCSELTGDEQLALASEISDKLEGRAIALVKRDLIVLDELTDEEVSVETVRPIVVDFVSRRKDARYYSVEIQDDLIQVHSADPIRAKRRREQVTLPPNLKQCPMCSFVTEYDEEYQVHVRSHFFGV